MEKNIVQIQEAYGHKQLLEELALLQDRYPELEVTNIGKSVLGRSLPAVRLGTGCKQIHFNGAFHANEWITSIFLMVFLEKLLQAASTQGFLDGVFIPKLLTQISLYIVPMVNPDGVDLVQNGFSADNSFYPSVLRANKGSTNFQNWKANIRGVDLNDQFPAYWENEYQRRETEGPAPLNYPGPSPLSEPEAQAMAEFTLAHDFQRVLAFHTQGEEIYWGYRQLEPPSAQTIVNQLQKVSGYRAVRYVESDAGYKDWFIYKWRRPGFTVECGSGKNPLPLQRFEAIWQKVSRLMLTSLVID